jgi:hypothetical protein
MVEGEKAEGHVEAEEAVVLIETVATVLLVTSPLLKIKKTAKEGMFSEQRQNLEDNEVSLQFEAGRLKYYSIFLRSSKNCGQKYGFFILCLFNSTYFRQILNFFINYFLFLFIEYILKRCFPIDLRHAYLSVPIAEDDQKYLGFNWKGTTYQYIRYYFCITFFYKTS